MMKYKISVPTDKLKIIRRGDKDFYFKAGLQYTPRAGFEISPDCPENYKIFLMDCIKNEWIKPVAYMKESEYAWEKLGE